MVERKTGVPDLLPATKPGVRTYQEAERLLFLCLEFVSKDKARAWHSSAKTKHVSGIRQQSKGTLLFRRVPLLPNRGKSYISSGLPIVSQ